MYTKKKPLPGQLDNCERCGTRFTVTPYSKTGLDGGLLCRPCSKEHEAERKKDASLQKSKQGREKRRNVQSNLLDGNVPVGSKTLLEYCIKVGLERLILHLNEMFSWLLKVVGNNIHDIDEFGDLPQSLLDRLSQLLSKQRTLTPRTLDLFLRTDLRSLALYDCARKS